MLFENHNYHYNYHHITYSSGGVNKSNPVQRQVDSQAIVQRGVLGIGMMERPVIQSQQKQLSQPSIGQQLMMPRVALRPNTHLRAPHTSTGTVTQGTVLLNSSVTTSNPMVGTVVRGVGIAGGGVHGQQPGAATPADFEASV